MRHFHASVAGQREIGQLSFVGSAVESQAISRPGEPRLQSIASTDQLQAVRQLGSRPDVEQELFVGRT